MKKPIPAWAIIFGVLLASYTAYVMLDVFVIRRPMQENATGMNMALFALTPSPTPIAKTTPTPEPTATPKPTVPLTPGTTPLPTATPEPTEPPTPTPSPEPTYFTADVVETETTYSNDHLWIEISEIREHDTQIHIAEIRVTSAQYILSAFAEDKYGRNIFAKTSEMAAANDAVFAINGDNYGAREGGYCIRNGILYRKTGNRRKDVLCIMPDGDFKFSHYEKATAQELLNMGTWQALTFGPVLIDDSEIKVDVNAEVDFCYATNPRTAIGMIEPLHYYVIVADGRTKTSHGLSVYQVADLFKRLGCTKAFNLDGGGSSTMVFRGKVINFPTSDGGYYERGVTDIVYFR